MELRCPICRRPTNSLADPHFPFCSERCRLIDLGNWSSEKYKVAAPLMDESEPEDSDPRERRGIKDDEEEGDD